MVKNTIPTTKLIVKSPKVTPVKEGIPTRAKVLIKIVLERIFPDIFTVHTLIKNGRVKNKAIKAIEPQIKIPNKCSLIGRFFIRIKDDPARATAKAIEIEANKFAKFFE